MFGVKKTRAGTEQPDREWVPDYSQKTCEDRENGKYFAPVRDVSEGAGKKVGKIT